MKITDHYMAESSPDNYVRPNNLANVPELVVTSPMPATLKINGVYDRMNDWGCISPPFAMNILGRCVNEWEVHEEWNVNMTLAIM